MSEERLVKAGLPIDLDPFLIPDGTKAFDDKKGSLNFNKGFLAVSSLAIAIPLGGCTIAQEQTPTPVQNESVSITQVTEQITPTPTPTETPTPTATPEPRWDTVLKDANPDFFNELTKQDKNAKNHFRIENGKTYLILSSGEKVEVDPSTAAINVDINGKPLQVEDAGFPNPLTIHGKVKTEDGEREAVFAYAPETTITLNDQGETKTFEGHWFEVIQPNHQVDINETDRDKLRAQLLEAINDPVRVTVDQIQSGEWAMSVLLSGYVQPIPDDWKFTGNALNHSGKLTVIYTTETFIAPNPKNNFHIPFFGVVEVSGVDFAIRPFRIWNPVDQQNPDHKQILIATLGFGPIRTSELANYNFINDIFLGGVSAKLIVEDPNYTKAGIQQSGLLADGSLHLLKQLPGNDPTKLNYIARIIQQFNKTYGARLWQTTPFYIDPEYMNVENIIWLFYF